MQGNTIRTQHVVDKTYVPPGTTIIIVIIHVILKFLLKVELCTIYFQLIYCLPGVGSPFPVSLNWVNVKINANLLEACLQSWKYFFTNHVWMVRSIVDVTFGF